MAPTSTALIIGRAIAGLGSAGIFTGALVTIAYTVPLVKRPIFFGLIGGMYGIASVAGPLVSFSSLAQAYFSVDGSNSLVELLQIRSHGGGASILTVSTSHLELPQLSLTKPVPLGAFTAAGLLLFLKFDGPKKRERLSLGRQILRFDPIGTTIFIPAIVCLLLALQWGGTTYPWNDGRVIALFVLFGILLIAFIGVQIWLGEEATGKSSPPIPL